MIDVITDRDLGAVGRLAALMALLMGMAVLGWIVTAK
jgi:hypothetical protein